MVEAKLLIIGSGEIHIKEIWWVKYLKVKAICKLDNGNIREALKMVWYRAMGKKQLRGVVTSIKVYGKKVNWMDMEGWYIIMEILIKEISRWMLKQEKEFWKIDRDVLFMMVVGGKISIMEMVFRNELLVWEDMMDNFFMVFEKVMEF